MDADPDQREKQISAFQSSHDEWQEYKRILDLHETKGVPFSDDDVKQLLGEEYHDNTKDDGKSLTIESIAHLIFRPGMKYVGTICIPSLGNIYDDDSDEEDEIDAHVSRNAASSTTAALTTMIVFIIITILKSSSVWRAIAPCTSLATAIMGISSTVDAPPLAHVTYHPWLTLIAGVNTLRKEIYCHSEVIFESCLIRIENSIDFD